MQKLRESLKIELSEEELSRLMNDETFDWTYEGITEEGQLVSIDIHLSKEE